jgi:hypothetical protein
MPVKTGIQMSLKLWIPGRASYRQLARNDDSILVRTSVSMTLIRFLFRTEARYEPKEDERCRHGI